MARVSTADLVKDITLLSEGFRYVFLNVFGSRIHLGGRMFWITRESQGYHVRGIEVGVRVNSGFDERGDDGQIGWTLGGGDVYGT